MKHKKTLTKQTSMGIKISGAHADFFLPLKLMPYCLLAKCKLLTKFQNMLHFGRKD